MLTALVLVCSIATTPNLRDCDASNARVIMRVPEAYASPAACAMQGQAYFAETAIGRSLASERPGESRLHAAERSRGSYGEPGQSVNVSRERPFP